jgi:hypothetical protein
MTVRESAAFAKLAATPLAGVEQTFGNQKAVLGLRLATTPLAGVGRCLETSDS